MRIVAEIILNIKFNQNKVSFKREITKVVMQLPFGTPNEFENPITLKASVFGLFGLCETRGDLEPTPISSLGVVIHFVS